MEGNWTGHEINPVFIQEPSREGKQLNPSVALLPGNEVDKEIEFNIFIEYSREI